MAIKKRKAPYVPLPADKKGYILPTPDFKSRVKPSFKNETDINTIVARHLQAGGAAPGPMRPSLVPAPVVDSRLLSLPLADRLNFAKSLHDSFATLPKNIRDQVGSLSELSKLSPNQIEQFFALPPAAPPADPPPSPPKA